MNTKTIVLLAGSVLAGFLASDLTAQTQNTNAPRIVVPTNAPGARPVMRDRTDFWAQRLNLTDEQKVKIKPILDEESQRYADLRKQTNLKPEERRTNYMVIREEIAAKMKPILTPEQYEKYTRPFQPRTNAPQIRLTNAVPVAPPATPAK
jgi:Spy/CpxP family protein refolding chaperone